MNGSQPRERSAALGSLQEAVDEHQATRAADPVAELVAVYCEYMRVQRRGAAPVPAVLVRRSAWSSRCDRNRRTTPAQLCTVIGAGTAGDGGADVAGHRQTPQRGAFRAAHRISACGNPSRRRAPAASQRRDRHAGCGRVAA